MVQFRHITTYHDADGTYTRNIMDMQVVASGQNYTLLSANHLGGGIASYSLSSADTQIKLISKQLYGPEISYLDSPKLGVVTVAGQSVILPAGMGAGTSFGASLQPSGGLRPHPGFPALPDDIIDIGQFSTVSGQFVYTARDGSAGYDIWRANGSTLRKIDSYQLPKNQIPPDSEINDIEIVDVGPNKYIVSVAALADSVLVQAINPDGTLGVARSLHSSNGIGISKPTQIETVTVAGVTYVVVASAESSSLTTMRLTADGNLVSVDHIIDERSTRFAGATAMETVMVDGRAFIFVGGKDDGLSVFTVMPGGILLHLANLVDRDGWSLADVAAIKASQIGDKIAVFVTSKTEGGISQFSFDPGKIGQTITTGSGNVTGTNGNDMLLAGRGTLRINGGAGDDILIAGEESVALTGGAGADIFVASAIKGRIAIMDYEHGVDRLDLSNLGMIRSTSQLVMKPQNYGIKIFYGETVIDIFSKNGQPLLPSHFTNEMFPHAHYPPVILASEIRGTDGNDTLTASPGRNKVSGMAGDDIIYGSVVDDVLKGGSGNDTIHGDAGNDHIMGDEGNDLLYGGLGNDLIEGGAGHDTLFGDQGDDILSGGDGNDILWGGAGNDTLQGGAGNDKLYGEDGDDELSGHAGNDQLFGGIGHDRLDGGAGDDTLDGGPGNDTLLGGDGHDHMTGGSGEDYMEGGAGNDTIFGNMGHDTIFGGDGHDSLMGQLNDDLIYGGLGNDYLSGGPGDDTLYGERGNDTLEGNLGNDLLIGGAGDDLMRGGLGDDTLQGGIDNDTLFGNDGNDRLMGEAGNDFLDGADGNDTLHGGAGDDELWGRAGNDKLHGGIGDDSLYGGLGDDFLNGNAGHDWIEGGEGNDTLNGGLGRDVLIGGPGADIMTGGLGTDSFVFTSRRDYDGSTDVITDFRSGEDSLDLRGMNIRFIGQNAFSAKRQARFESEGNDTMLLIDLDGDGLADLSVLLQGLSQLRDSDFLL